MDRVRDKIAIVTGGALGLGAASARMLAREGAYVVITDIKDSEGEAVAKVSQKLAEKLSTCTTMLRAKTSGSRSFSALSKNSGVSTCW